MDQLYLQKENYFGKKIYFPIAAFRNHPRLAGFIRMQLIPLFKELGMNPEKTFNSIIEICNNYLEQYKTQGNSINNSMDDLTKEAERELHRTFDFFDFAQNDRMNEIQRVKQLKARAEKIYRQIRVPIKKYLDGREIKLLDMGCGDGLVTWVLRRHEKDLNVKFKRTYLADVVGDNFPDYRVQKVKNNEKEYPFIPLDHLFSNLDIPNGDEPIRLDCILLLTVLHHCTNPEEVFRTCWKFLN
ncbi:MAG: class I SAM-dependent methyltransferase, partial [Candidatus Aminicenantes bacterium]